MTTHFYKKDQPEKTVCNTDILELVQPNHSGELVGVVVKSTHKKSRWADSTALEISSWNTKHALGSGSGLYRLCKNCLATEELRNLILEIELTK